MARIRTIKPEFFTSEDIVSLSPLARILYVALWCESDREGRMVWKPRTFKMRYLPADDCDIEALCSELITAQLVKLYGEGLAYIPRFGAHQHLNPREADSQLPDPHASPTRARRVSTRVSTVETRDSDTQGGREGKGKEGDKDASADGDASSPFIALLLNDGSDHVVTSEQVAEWSSSFPAVDVQQQLRAMREWCKAKPSRRKTSRGINSFIVSWLSRTQDRGGSDRMNGHEPDSSAGFL